MDSSVQAVQQGSEADAASKALSQLFIEYCQPPAFTKGYLYPSPTKKGLELLYVSTQRDFEANNNRTFVNTLQLSGAEAGQAVAAPSFGFELRGTAMSVPSPSGKRMFTVRNPGDDKKTGVLLEIWGGGRLLREVEVPAATHGAVYAEGYYEGVAWSSDESKILYVAEAPAEKRTPLWGGRAAAPPKGKAGAPPAEGGWRGQGEMQEDWGELFTGKKQSALYVLDTKDWSVTPVAGLPDGTMPGQPVWTPCGAGIVFAAWLNTAPHFGTDRRLGSAHCFNRLASLYYVDAPAVGVEAAPAAKKLTPSVQNAFSPRFTPDGSQLVFLSHDEAVRCGGHNATAAMHRLPWAAAGKSAAAAADAAAASAPSCVIPAIGAPSARGGFPGLYPSGQLCRSPWLPDGRLVMLSTWGSGEAIIAVDVAAVEKGAEQRVERLTPAPAEGGGQWSLLDVSGGCVVGVQSSPNRPAEMRALFPGSGGKWVPLAPPAEPLPAAVEAALAGMTWRIVDVAAPGKTTAEPAEMEGILLLPPRPAGSPPPPVILLPHGGPHVASSAGYFPSLAFLAGSGFAVLQANYRGSTGFGQAALSSLIGRAGSQDVADCVAILEAAVALGAVDGSRASYVGGSHGGFLGGHLAGQHPDRFRCFSLRNPVTSISSMVGITDIPDWCFVETPGLGVKAFAEPPSAEQLALMQAASPVAHIDKVKAPVLLMLGAKDRRVPPSNGLQYFHALKSRGKTVKCLWFPEDEHGLSKPRTELESYLTMLDWLKAYGLE